MVASSEYPRLKTERLVLRAFTLEDVPGVQRLAGAREVAATTLNIPHPYREKVAEAWISTHEKDFRDGVGVTFAIERREDGALIGAIGLRLDGHDGAELGYWIGVPYWNRGYCTEAAREVIRYGFEGLGVHRVHSYHFGSNPASGRVLQKVGMKYEGTRREHFRKWDAHEDGVEYGMLEDDYRG